MIAINFERLLPHSVQIKKTKTTTTNPTKPRKVVFSLAALAYENIILDKNGQGTDEET